MAPDNTVSIVLAAIFGLLIGSFLNVCIYRLPRDLSVVRPRSFCPGCEATISAWENIPVVSYLFLRGKCSHCKARISPRYPSVELATSVMFAWFMALNGFTLLTLRDCVLGSLLLALIFTDLETLLLPEELTIGGILLGLVFSLFVPVGDDLGWLLGLHGRAASFINSIAGVLIPAFPLWLTGWIFEKVRHKQGLGFGDVVMIAEVGAFLGVRSALLTLVLASVAGSMIGVAYISLKRKDMATFQLPLGSFLGAAGIFILAFGGMLMRWYSGLFA